MYWRIQQAIHIAEEMLGFAEKLCLYNSLYLMEISLFY